MGCLAGAYKGVSGSEKEALQALLLRSVVAGRDAARLCAVQWAAKLFPFDDMAARWAAGAGGMWLPGCYDVLPCVAGRGQCGSCSGAGLSGDIHGHEGPGQPPDAMGAPPSS